MGSRARKFKIRIKTVFFFSFLIIWIAANSQEWQNPGEKYTSAYKKYLAATCPIPKDSIRHFVYFARDRESIIDHPFLEHPMFKGAQIMYTWKDFEAREGQYDFSILKDDYEYLKKYGKKIFVQLQDATFNPKYKAVPEYLYTDVYDGGASLQYNSEGKPEGWVAKRWNKKSKRTICIASPGNGKRI